MQTANCPTPAPVNVSAVETAAKKIEKLHNQYLNLQNTRDIEKFPALTAKAILEFSQLAQDLKRSVRFLLLHYGG